MFFLLLLALNIGVGCWLYFAPHQTAHAFAAADPGVRKLVLLSERDHAGESNAAELASAPESAADLKNDSCVSIGPFGYAGRYALGTEFHHAAGVAHPVP